jgi:biotin carboxyl carrier protein
MKLTIEFDGSRLPLELNRDGAEWLFQLDASAERRAQVSEAEPSVYSVLLDGRSYDARVEEAADGTVVVVIAGRRFEIGVRDPRRWSRKHGGPGAEGRHHVIAPMPGKVVRVLVAPGDEVVAGQGLLVVEAMKMQNEMKAIRPGRVVSVAAREGETVGAGEILAIIE